MAAFAQFGSDLDPASQRLLHRGERLTEMLKQGQYSPLSMEQEVLIVFVGNQGYLDKLAVEQIKAFERELYSYFESKHSDILEEIKGKRELTDELRGRLIKALDQYVEVFNAEHAGATAAA